MTKMTVLTMHSVNCLFLLFIFGVNNSSANDVSDTVAAVSNLIGIGLSVSPVPMLSVIPLALGALLPVVWPGDNPRQVIDAVRNELLSRDIAGFKDTVKSIKQHARTDEIQAARRLVALEVDLNNAKCHFMPTGDWKNKANYFLNFATIHLYVLGTLTVTYQNDSHYRFELRRNAKIYAECAYHLRHVLYSKDSLRAITEDSIDKWKQLLTSDNQSEFNRRYYVHFSEPVGFRLDSGRYWLVCERHYIRFTRILGNCPSPIYHGGLGYVDYLDAVSSIGTPVSEEIDHRGNLLRSIRVEPIDSPRSDNIVRTCDRVGLRMHGHDSSLWLSAHSTYKLFRGTSRAGSTLRNCPGTDASRMRDGSCHCERWKLLLADNTRCGVPIKDENAVYLSAYDENGPYCEGRSCHQTRFRIYRFTSGDYSANRRQFCGSKR